MFCGGNSTITSRARNPVPGPLDHYAFSFLKREFVPNVSYMLVNLEKYKSHNINVKFNAAIRGHLGFSRVGGQHRLSYSHVPLVTALTWLPRTLKTIFRS